MTKVMWLGEDSEDYAGPSYTIWNGIKFPKDVAVDVQDQQMLGKARGNRFFKVIEEKKQQENSHGESQTQEDQVKEQSKEQKDKGTGYSPVKKKVRKKKPQEATKEATDTTAA